MEYVVEIDDVDGFHYGTETLEVTTLEEAVQATREATNFASALVSQIVGREINDQDAGMLIKLYRVEGDQRTEVFWRA